VSKNVKVSLQGISQDLSQATGSYDPVELGEMTPDGLLGVLQKVVTLQALQGDGSQDLCPPSMVLDCGGRVHSFHVEDGQLVDSESGGRFGIFDAVSFVTGQRGGSGARPEARPGNVRPAPAKKPAPKPQPDADGTEPLVWGSDNPDCKGLSPLRKTDIPPTDREVVGVDTIDTGPGCPQFSMTVWKSVNAKGLPLGILVLGLFIGFMALVLFGTGNPGPGFVVALAAGGCFWLKGVWARHGKTDFRVGFDWKANAIWAKRGSDKVVSWIGNANCITDFTISEYRYTKTVRTGGPMGNVKATESIWQLDVHKNNGSCVFLYRDLATKAEAEEAAAKAKALLASQG
jgi:hypothetical protein